MTRARAPVSDHAVAIVGMAGRFPGAANPQQLWRNIKEGRESITFFTPTQLASAGVSPAAETGVTHVPARAVIDRAAAFDHDFFGFTRREALAADPQLRLTLETIWSAMEDAGCRPDTQPATGVFLGARPAGYAALTATAVLRAGDELVASIGTDSTFFATRASYKLGFKGPSLTVQTACSSSLMAVHLGCAALRNRECDLAVAGGVCVHAGRVGSYPHFEGSIMSADGHCRPFDTAATGTVDGEGVAVIVLKRIADAIADADDIYAVILGSAVNNDGNDKIGYAAPSISGQADVIRAALRDADVQPSSVDFVETHGTGTALGDPVELEGLRQAYAAGRDAPLTIGSLKANIGHLDAAAGVASLIKAALALRAGVFPPLVNFRSLNPGTPADGFFRTPTRALPWPRTSHPRRAGVSSFGIGGTNVHVILQEPQAVSPPDHARGPEVLIMSARTTADLAALSDQLSAWLDTSPPARLADVAHTLQTGRKPFGHRHAIVAARQEGAGRMQLRRVREFTGNSPLAEVVMAFSGQGTQRPGLTASVYRRWPAFRQALDELLEHAGADARAFLLSPAGDRQPSRPAVAQAAVFAEQWAFARLLADWGVRPIAVAGNSIGEYAAACAAGIFAPREAARLLAIRGELCERLCPRGAMLAVAAGAERAGGLLVPDTWVAISAGAARCTISGRAEAIERLRRRLSDAKIACQLLPVDRAYHSTLMQPAAEPFAKEVARSLSGDYALPLASSVTGEWLGEQEAADPAYWAHRHLTEPLRLDRAMATLAAADAAVVNAGQHDGQIRNACASGGTAGVIPVMPASADGDPAVALLSACARLWTEGIEIDWRKTRPGAGARRVHLPTYPFAGPDHWPAPAPGPVSGAMTPAPAPGPVSGAMTPAPPRAADPASAAATAVAAVAESAPEQAEQGRHDEIAQVVGVIFEEVLGACVGDPDTTFFELGGDSLTAAQAVARIGEAYPPGLSLREFFDDPSIRALASTIERLHMEPGA